MLLPKFYKEISSMYVGTLQEEKKLEEGDNDPPTNVKWSVPKGSKD